MGKAKHGRCRRGIRLEVGSIGRLGVGLLEVRRNCWKGIAQGLSSEDPALLNFISPAAGA